MQVTVEESSGLNRTLKVHVPEDTIQENVDQRIRSLGRNAKIPGFRPGKVPQKLIREQFGAQARKEVISDLLTSSFRDALTEKNMVPVGTPEITEMQADGGQGLEYLAKFEVFPEIEIKSCSDLTLKRSVCEVSSSDVDETIEKLREQHRTWSSVDRASRQGDRVQISYRYTAGTDDESVKHGSFEKVWVQVGQSSLTHEFDEKINNVSAGDHLEFSLVFPDDYNHQSLAGKPADFEVDVLAVEEPGLPVVDEDFIKKFGIEDPSVETFRAELLKNLEREMTIALRQRQKSEVLLALYENNPILVPQSMVNAELGKLLKPYREAAEKQNIELDDTKLASRFMQEAQRRVALGMIVGKIIEDNQLKADPDRVKQTVEIVASGYENPQALVEWYYSDQKRLQEIQHSVLEDQAVEWVMEQAQVVDESLTFSELMRVNANAGK